MKNRPLPTLLGSLALAAASVALAQPTTAPAAAEEKPNVAREAPVLTNVRQLVFEGKRSGEGYFSSDGKMLTFQSEREANDPFYQIYTLDLESGDTTRVSTGKGKTTCSWFRPGTHDEVLFASTHLDPDTEKHQQEEIAARASGKQRRYAWDYDEHMDLFVSRAGGGEPTRLTDARGYDAEGSFSPDGKLIAFCSTRSAYDHELTDAERKQLEVDPSFFGEIYLMNADGSDVRRLTHSPGYDGGPFFSPDGKRIIWRRFDKTGAFADVYTMNLDGSDERRITDFGAMSWAPYFHPSGDYIVFASNKLGFSNFEVYLVDAAGAKEPVRVTYSAGFDGLPVFSPDGSKLAWTSSRTADGKSQIFLSDWNDQAARQLLAKAPNRTEASHADARASDPSATNPATQPTANVITPEALKSHVAYLASDALEGRLTGTDGARKASEYLADQLQQMGYKPANGQSTLLQSFDYTAGVELDAPNNKLRIGDQSLTLSTDFAPASFAENAIAKGDVVFAGYGLKTAGDGEHGYDSYAGLDVKGKVVLVLRYAPENVDAARKEELNRYAGLRYKAMLARDRGATALLVVTGPNSPGAGELLKLSSNDREGSCGIPVLTLSADAAARLLAGTGKDLKSIQTALDNEDPHAETTFNIPAHVEVQTSLTRRRATDRNVIAMLPPDSNANAQYVLIGAHYDHLGHGEAGNSLDRSGEEGQVHNGADDNASGDSVVLEIARAFAAQRQSDPTLRNRGLIVGLWSGEELGLLGSSAFAAHPPVPMEQIVACVSFDMVGRLRENKLVVQGTGSSSVWPKLIEKRNVAAGFSIAMQPDPYLPTDSTSFYAHGVPTVNFFTGAHEDYHRPTDDTDTLDYNGMARIARLANRVVNDLVVAPERPDYVKVESTAGGSREALRVYIGSIPDYAAEGSGVKLSGVRGGSPAEKAGLKGDDVIVEFAGKPIANIYDYTYAIETAKVGQPLDVVVLRGGQRVTLHVTPEARKQ